MLKSAFTLAAFLAVLTEAGHHKTKKHEEHDPCTYKKTGALVKKKKCKKLAKEEGVCIWDKDVDKCVTAREDGSEASAMAQVLQGAIKRGVPMYNAGHHEACAMIYETALHAIILGPGWGLRSVERDMLEEGFMEGMQMKSDSDKAWAYRRLMNRLLAPRKIALAHHTSNVNEKMLFDFESPLDLMSWEIVLDGVMGGKSTGYTKIKDDKLIFHGETSLENNGGFSSIRADITAGSLADLDTLRLRVMGDGREYILATSAGGAFSYWSKFETKDGKWMSLDFPISEMKRHWYGMELQGRIEPSDISQVQLYIYDKEEGPFRLEVDTIEAM